MRLVAAVAIAAALPLANGRDAAREIAITFDDLPFTSVLEDEGGRWVVPAYALLTSLLRHQVPAVGFVNEQKLERNGEADPVRLQMLRDWLKAAELGNHTYAHLDFHSADIETLQREVMRGERITRRMADEAGKPLRFFRHPFLHTGRSLEARRQFERFLADRGYRVAPVTMDNYDYVFAAAYERTPDQSTRDRVVGEYVSYLTDVVVYYERQAVTLVGRDIRHVLLLHANALNARAFDDIALMLRNRGYHFVPLERALEDPVYQSRDTYVGPGGITWLHRWALTEGKRDGVFAGEPTIPDWIQEAARPRARH